MMNRIYKLVWNEARNMYVAVSEFARSHTKSSKSSVFSKTLAVGVLSCVLSFGLTIPTEAAPSYTSTITWPEFTSAYYTLQFPNSNGWWFGINKTDGTIAYASFNEDYTGISSASGYYGAIWKMSGNATVIDTLYGTGGTTYTAGDGITISEDTISITAGSITSGNVNAVSGGTAYTELRPSDNGNYVKVVQNS